VRSTNKFYRCYANDLHRDKIYVAIKALKGNSTRLAKQGITWEIASLNRLTSKPPTSGVTLIHCAKLLSHFTYPGKGQDGDHLCIVTEVLGGDVKSLRASIPGMKKFFPLPLAKRILLHTLRGIAHMHSCGVVHTDLKLDNIMFDIGPVKNDYFISLTKTDPPRLHPPEESWDCIVQAAVSQPLPLPSLSEAMERTYIVADFGSGEQYFRSCETSPYRIQHLVAQPAALHTVRNITANALRAPEVILRGAWDEKVDIWIFGCLVCQATTIGSAAEADWCDF
jgi:serine/threonine protein kinase